MNTADALRQRVQAAPLYRFSSQNPLAEPLGDAVLEVPKPPHCPKCDAEMLTISYRGVEIDRCPGCGGLWFDVLEHAELRKLDGSERVDEGDPQLGQRFDQLEGVFRCPRCDTPLTRVTDSHQPQIHFEKCPRDYGVFLDAGEFHDFKQRTFSQRLRELFG